MRTLFRSHSGPGDSTLVEPAPDGVPLREVLARAGNERVLLDLRGVDPRDTHSVASEAEAQAVGELQLQCASLSGRVVSLLSGEVRGQVASLALACNVRVAEHGTCLHFPEITEGLIPPGETLWYLVRRCPLSEALALLVRGSVLDCQAARKRNLLDAVGPARELPFLARHAAPSPPAPRERVLASRLRRFLLRRQAVAELKHRGSSEAAVTAVELLFRLFKAPARQRIKEVAQTIGRLARGREHALLLCVAEARRRYLPQGGALPRRALVVAGAEGWRWACLLAHCGVSVRWVWPEEKVLGEGLWYLRRDTERYFPERLDHILRRVTVSSAVAGFAGRDLVILQDPSQAAPAVRREAGQRGALLLWGSFPGKEPCIEVPSDPLTSRVCRLTGAPSQLRSFVEGLGFLPLGEEEAQVVFRAAAAWTAAWERLRQAGVSPESIVGSLLTAGFNVRDLLRRYLVVGKVPRSSTEYAELFLTCLKEACAAAGGQRDLVELALHLEFGTPVHRVSITGA